MEEPVKKKLKAQTVITMEHHGSYAEIGKVYHKLYEWGKEHNVKLKGRSLTIVLSPPNEFDPASAVFEVCMPVVSPPQGDAKVKVKELPACTVASATVKGPYDKIPAHYTEMLAWIDAQGYEISGPPREVYIKTPHVAGDSKECVTEIQFPVSV